MAKLELGSLRLPLVIVIVVATVSLTVSCGLDLEEELGVWRGPVTAICSVNVTGKGIKDVENDYIPHVVACENGSADTEALKAQAVSARTYTYYKAKSDGGSICDSTLCQVYTCANKPAAKHYAAAKATAGQVLMYNNLVICAFYVAGAKPSTTTCKALSSDPDPTNTEKYVTYNEGKSGSQVTQSTLGWVSPTNYYNRGCKSQNGAHCLSLRQKLYPEILRFYYGADIGLVTATGSCVQPVVPDASVKPPDTRPPDSEPPQPDQQVLVDTIAPGPDQLLDDGAASLPPDQAWRDGLGSGEEPGTTPQGLVGLMGGCSVAAVAPARETAPSAMPSMLLLGFLLLGWSGWVARRGRR